MNKEVLKGVIDIHVHPGPEAFKTRKCDEYDLARQAIACGARGIVIKTHVFETAARAQLVRKAFPGFEMWGGITLNKEVGLNADAVRAVASLGGKFVWLPTMDSVLEHRCKGLPGGVECVRDGHTLLELDRVLEVIAQEDLVLATGHLDWQEQVIVVRRAKELGVNRIVVNHPTLYRISMPLDAQREMASYGAYLERNYGGSRIPVSKEFERHFDRNIADIKALGAESSIMATDLGQPNNPDWSNGFAEYIEYALAHGVTQKEIDMMTKENPARLLGLR